MCRPIELAAPGANGKRSGRQARFLEHIEVLPAIEVAFL
jgi:hypothetical protein